MNLLLWSGSKFFIFDHDETENLQYLAETKKVCAKFFICRKEHDNVSLARETFQDNAKLETFIISDCPGVNVIDPQAFHNVKSLTKVKIEETNLDLIHPNIFEHNKNLKEINSI